MIKKILRSILLYKLKFVQIKKAVEIVRKYALVSQDLG